MDFPAGVADVSPVTCENSSWKHVVVWECWRLSWASGVVRVRMPPLLPRGGRPRVAHRSRRSGLPISHQQVHRRDAAAPEKKDEVKASSDAGKSDAPPPLEAPKTGAVTKADAAVTLLAAEIDEIKALPAGEQATALAQAVCPVSGEHLGSMGMPLKITAEGRTFYLCCKGCKDEVTANPKAVIAKLDKK